MMSCDVMYGRGVNKEHERMIVRERIGGVRNERGAKNTCIIKDEAENCETTWNSRGRR